MSLDSNNSWCGTNSSASSNNNNSSSSNICLGLIKLNWPELLYASICVFGSLPVIINVSIFLSPTLKDHIYKFLLFEAIVDLLYLICIGLSIVFSCGSPCAYVESKLIAKIYSLVIYDYATSCMAITNIFIELFLAIQRLFVIMNKPFLIENNLFICGTLTLLSMAYYLPVFFLKSIVKLDNDKYDVVWSEFGRASSGQLLYTFLSTFRLFLVTVCLFSINLFTFLKFQQHIARKAQLTNLTHKISQEEMVNATTNKDSRAKRNLTLMIISVSFLYTFATLPWACYKTILSNTITTDLSIIRVVSLSSLYLLVPGKFFIYYFFNRLFRQIFRQTYLQSNTSNRLTS
jgi:hypothetical protein